MAFLLDITQFIQVEIAKGNKLLLCIDTNTPWDHADIRGLKVATGMKNLMKTANLDISLPPATYDRGDDEKGSIDTVLGCDSTAEALTTARFYGIYSTNWSYH